jgi:hypothetical protein
MNSGYTYVQVDTNENTPMMASLVFKNIGPAFAVKAVRIFEGLREGELYDVTGWSSATADGVCPAYAVRIEDSSAGTAYLVFGGDMGIRLRPTGSMETWTLSAGDQFGETHLVLADAEDIVAES